MDTKIIPQNHEDSKELLCSWVNCDVIAIIFCKYLQMSGKNLIFAAEIKADDRTLS